ncbi:uncharacterized protein EV420DRAFT_1571948 [Desarmillaria tabescens]|uniref:Uncharacterized protein n=1 Tax=Armillaria tabescens TaxID=1929756 RepID=A0AA39JNN4_ARMTA|nr:uncharacterized protein EV420DRAFT_1571948 [Desarmillaria tabescens]KAK0445632.1 hypothetical protein EV420DRAFT_1571948 [Desarmillaria tabescens]
MWISVSCRFSFFFSSFLWLCLVVMTTTVVLLAVNDGYLPYIPNSSSLRNFFFFISAFACISVIF